MNNFYKKIGVWLLSIACFTANGQTLRQIQTPFNYTAGNGSAYSGFTTPLVGSYEVNNRVVFLTTGGGHGFYVHSTDGTDGGTIQLLGPNDIYSLSKPDTETYQQYLSRTGIFRVANTGKLLYLFFKEGTSNKYFLWRTDGTKEGTYQLPVIYENQFPPSVSNYYLVKDHYFVPVREKNEWVVYQTTGTKESVKFFKKNISILGNETENHSNYLFYTGYTVSGENTVYDPNIKAYDTRSGVEKTFSFEENPTQHSLLYADDDHAFVTVLTSAPVKRQLWELDLKTGTKRKILETSNTNILSESGHDHISLFKYENGLILQVSNSKLNTPLPPPTTWSLKKGSTAMEKIGISSSIESHIYYKGQLFTKSGTQLHISDGTAAGTRMLAEFKGGNGYFDETRGIVSEPSITVVKDKLFYFVRTSNQTTRRNDYAIWQVDATFKPSLFMDNIRGFSSFYEIKGKLYFTDHEHIYESDGTIGGTQKIVALAGYIDRKLEVSLGNSTPSMQDFVQLYKVLRINDKLILDQNYLGGIGASRISSKEEYRKMYNTSGNVAIGQSLRFSFDPSANAESCGSMIYFTSPCTGQPAYSAFVKYPQSKLEWYRNDTLLVNAPRDSLAINQNGIYKVKSTYKNCIGYSNEMDIKVNAPKIALKIQNENSTTGPWDLTTTVTGGYRGENPNAPYQDWTHRVFYQDKEVQLNLFPNYPLNYNNIQGSAKGNYTVVVTDYRKCRGQATIKVGEGGGNTGNLTATISSHATTVYAPNAIILTANSGTGYTYQWRRNGVNIAGATGATYEAKESGSYTVVITANGQSVTSNSIVLTVQVPLATEPEISGIEVSVFPNPAEREVNAEIRLGEELPVRVEIYTREGKKLKQWHSESRSFVHRPVISLGSGLEGQQLLMKVSTDKSFVTKKIFVK